jgi:protein-tyrosine phosphatase
MQMLANKAGFKWQVDSAGTGFWHVDELPDRRSINVAASHGIDIRDQRARQFQAADFDRFDRILVMDGQNLRDVSRLAVKPEHREKVVRILDVVYPGQERDVPDPYHDTDGFEAVFQMLDKACAALIT